VHELRYFGHRVNDLVRFPDSTTVRKFPDTVMTSYGPQRGYNVTTSVALNGVASDNIGQNRRAWMAFDTKVDGTDNTYWQMGDNSHYSSGTGDAVASHAPIVPGHTTRGGWLKLELPHKLLLTKIIVHSNNAKTVGSGSEGVNSAKIYGSNDDSTWYVVKDTYALNYADTSVTVAEDTISTSTAYKYIIFQITKTGGGPGALVRELEFYGTEVAEPVLARLGGSFEGKIANTRVYDRSIGERQVLEVWDAEKDRFGRGESSITVHKGRLGVGTKTPQATLDVRGNIFGPLLTHRSYVWRKPVITYVPAAQECRILAQVVEIPEMYKNISPLNLRLSYKWVWFGESSAETYYTFWRTNVKHSGNTVEHMNTGKEGGRPYGVSMSLTSIYTGDDSSTPEGAIIPGSYELKNVTGDTFEVELSMSPTAVMTLYTNRTVDDTDGNDYERGCSTLTVFMEPY
jgi:hypothetical protein